MLARTAFPAAGPNEIRSGQWAVLRYLVRAGSHARTISHVAKHHGVSGATASRPVAALPRKGFVRVKPDHVDRRVLRIEVTASGRGAAQA
jgi:DNA-binding MarR family transcriptional regulator